VPNKEPRRWSATVARMVLMSVFLLAIGTAGVWHRLARAGLRKLALAVRARTQQGLWVWRVLANRLLVVRRR
jgi:hypothetical protein